MTVEQIRDRLDRARSEVARLAGVADEAHASADAATPGGLHGDPATLSGVRRGGGHRQDRRRFGAYDRHAEATAALGRARAEVERLERELAAAERDEAAPCDVDALTAGDLVRDRHGWHVVKRVSAKSVTVETGHSWDDRIARTKIIETRKAAA